MVGTMPINSQAMMNADLQTKLTAFKIMKIKGAKVAYRLYPYLIHFLEQNQSKSFAQLEQEIMKAR